MTEEEDWIPPELAERAKITAERDAATAEKLANSAEKKKKRKPLGPPETRNPRFAFIVSGICLLFFLAGYAATYLTEPPVGSPRKILSWIGAVFSVLIYLKFMLPVLKQHHKLILGILLAGKLICNSATAVIDALAEADAANQASGLVSVVFLLLVSPMFWLLYGILRRQSSEKRAAIIQFVVFIILFLILLVTAIIWLVNRLQGKPYDNELLRLPRLFSMLQGAGLALLLMNWPVLDRPAGFEKAKTE